MGKTASLDKILSDTTAVEMVVSLCVAGKLVAEHQVLQDQLAKLPKESERLSGSARERKRIAEEIHLVEEMMSESTYDFTFRSISPKRYSDLVAKHPDKTGKTMWNPFTFPPALIAACCISPEGMDDPERLQELLDKLSAAQQQELLQAAWAVNNSSPKELISLEASEILRNYATNSDSATDTESPEASSSDE